MTLIIPNAKLKKYFKLSNGLLTFCKLFWLTGVYISVVLEFFCPSSFLIQCKHLPASYCFHLRVRNDRRCWSLVVFRGKPTAPNTLLRGEGETKKNYRVAKASPFRGDLEGSKKMFLKVPLHLKVSKLTDTWVFIGSVPSK